MNRLYSRWRRFLEPSIHDVDSYVVVEVPLKDGEAAVLLKIADCDRVIRLWFPWSLESSVKRSRHKLALLREALDKIEAGVERLHNSQ